MRRPELWCGLLIVTAFASTTAGLEADRASGSPDRPRLTIDRLYSLPHLIGTAAGGFAWSPDGRRLAFLWNDAGFNFRDVWTIDVADPDLQPVRVTSMPQASRPDRAAFADAVEWAEAEEAWELDRGVTRVIWHPDGQRLLVSHAADLWSIQGGSEPLRLTHTPSPEHAAAYSPDGRTLAFLRDGNLWFLKASAPESRRTELAEPDLELVDLAWSPDGTGLVVLQQDEREVARRGIPDYLAEETALIERRRAYPGEPPVRHRLGLIAAGAEETDTAGIRWVDWGNAEPDMLLSYRWSPNGRHLAVDTSDLYAKDRRIFVIDVEGDGPLKPRLVARDQDLENETFYFWRIEWSSDAQWLYFLSDRDEDYHVYAVSPDTGEDVRRLTRGPWAVAEMFAVDGGLVVVGNRDRAEERHLFHIDNDARAPTRLSQRPGTHAPTVSPDGRWAAVHFSSQSMPPELLLTSLAVSSDERQGTNPSLTALPRERRATHSPLAEFEDYTWVEADFVSFPSHVDGTTLHGRIALPPDFEPGRKYPAIVGSVYTDSVRNQWGWRTAHPTWGLDQFLLQEGYVVFNVDMRGSWGRGRDHRRGIRLDYGGIDIQDLESGVRFLATLGYVDMDRVGIWGSSYGGLMATMSLFRKPGLYAAGIAGAPATNVRHALAGQMAVMMRPEDQPEEYDDSSPFLHAQGLADPLMIIHGMRDQVVLFKDSVILAQRLVLLGKDFELVTLPNAGHGWDAEGLAQTRFAFHKMVEFFDRHLGNAPDEDGGTSHDEN